MTGRYQGVVTLTQRAAKPGFMRIWCGAHQLDLCLQSFYLAIPEALYSTLTLLVAYLRCQQNFISDERSQCPLISDTRWLNIIKVTTWFGKHRLAFSAYLDVKKPLRKPDDSSRIRCSPSMRLQVLLLSHSYPGRGMVCSCATDI